MMTSVSSSIGIVHRIGLTLNSYLVIVHGNVIKYASCVALTSWSVPPIAVTCKVGVNPANAAPDACRVKAPVEESKE